MSIEPGKKASLLAALGDEYEPTAEELDRAFAKIQAAAESLSASPSAAAPSAPSAIRNVGLKQGGNALLAGASCVILAFIGAMAFRTMHDRSPAAVAPGPTVTETAASPTATPPQPRRPWQAEAVPMPSIAVDALPTASSPLAEAKSRTAPVGGRLPSSSPTTVASAPPPNDTLEQEASLLAEVRRARQSGDGQRALSLVEEHARTFPNGWLSNDRDVERVVVLCSLGRRAEAIREAARFMKGHPEGTLARRVKMSCAGDRVPEAGQ